MSYLSKLRNLQGSQNFPPPIKNGSKAEHDFSTPISEFEALRAVADDDLALTIAAHLSPYIAASQVREAWDSLTPAEMVAIPEAPFKRAKDLPTDTIPELIAWRDGWLDLIRAAQNSDKTVRGQR